VDMDHAAGRHSNVHMDGHLYENVSQEVTEWSIIIIIITFVPYLLSDIVNTLLIKAFVVATFSSPADSFTSTMFM